MIKRPLCLAAVLFLGIQMIFVGGFQKKDDKEPFLLERNIKEGEKVSVTGTVYRREERPDYRTLYLTDVHVCQEEQFIEESKILVYIKQYQTQKSKTNLSENQVLIGNRISLTGEIDFFEAASNPGNFDRRFYYQKQNIHAAVWCEEIEIINSSVWKVSENLARLKMCWKQRLKEVLGNYYGNSLSAILLGDKGELNEDVKELYQKSGIGHIMAISGLHMSFLGMGMYQLLRRMGFSFFAAGLAGMMFLFLYTIMIGGGVSAQRALVMFFVRVGADMTGRDYDLPTSLALAAVVITMCQPLYLFDAGFLLSFGALAGIAVVNPVLEEWNVLPKIMRASMAIQLVLLPILLYYYFEIPIYAMFLNLLVIPMMSVVMGAGIFGSLLLVLWSGGGEIVLQICKFILWVYERTAQLTMELPVGRVVLGQPKKWWCIVYYVILFGGCAVAIKCREKEKEQGRQKQKPGKDSWSGKLWKSTCVILYGIVFCLGCVWGHGKPGEVKITAIDVGQGDGLYVRTPSGKHILIDGGSTSESQVGKYRIEPFLKSQGVGRLDYVFVSHGDADHINGIEELLKSRKMGISIEQLVFPTENVLDENLLKLAETAELCGTDCVVMQAGEQVKDEGMILTCLAPLKEYNGEIGNASSMVLELRYGEFEMLFTGDLEGEGEKQLIESGQLRDYDVLKAGHHGSKNSTSAEMLDMVLPEVTIISAGKENRYGHPHEETLKRLEKVKSKEYSTKEVGAVTVRTDGEKMWTKSYRQIKAID